MWVPLWDMCGYLFGGNPSADSYASGGSYNYIGDGNSKGWLHLCLLL